MKKIIAIFVALLLFPSAVLASEYTTTNLDETLTAEGIDAEYSDYEETSDQVVIYLFRGSGCSHCAEFLEFLNSIVDEYGEYFKVVAYEVWYDATDNATLLESVAEYFGETSYGVPFIVIGDNHWVGYTSSYDDEIISAILELYDEQTDSRFDILDALGEDSTTSKSSSSISSTTVLIIWNVILTVAIIYVIASYSSKLTLLNESVEELEKKVQKSVEKEPKKKEEPKEKKETKKPTKE